MDIDKNKLTNEGKKVLEIALKRCTGHKVHFLDGIGTIEKWNNAVGFTLTNCEEGIYLFPVTCDQSFIQEVQDRIGSFDAELTSFFDKDGRQLELVIESTEIAKKPIDNL